MSSREDRRYGDRDRYENRSEHSVMSSRDDRRYGDRDRYENRSEHSVMGSREDRRYGDRDRYENRYDRNHTQGDRFGDSMPELYSIFKGEVARIQTYGFFVRIPGFRKQGLVHKSQMSQARVEDPSEMVKEGESVYCKVISLQDDKVGLSMKVVNQGTGKDLDKNNVETDMDEQRRKTGHRRDSRPITLGAVLDTTCRKCGGKGHLAQDCYSGTVGKEYQLLPDNEDSSGLQENRSDPKKKHKDKKKKKKDRKDAEKKKHKKKKRHHSSSSSDSESDSERRHRDSHKKRKSQASSESSDSDTDQDCRTKKRKKHHTARSESSDSEPQRKHSHKHKYKSH